VTDAPLTALDLLTGFGHDSPGDKADHLFAPGVRRSLEASLDSLTVAMQEAAVGRVVTARRRFGGRPPDRHAHRWLAAIP